MPSIHSVFQLEFSISQVRWGILLCDISALWLGGNSFSPSQKYPNGSPNSTCYNHSCWNYNPCIYSIVQTSYLAWYRSTYSWWWAFTFDWEVKVTPTGLSMPAPFGWTASCAWHATGKAARVGSSVNIIYWKLPEGKAWNWLPFHHSDQQGRVGDGGINWPRTTLLPTVPFWHQMFIQASS